MKILDFRVRLMVREWLDAWLPPHGPIPPFERYIEVFGLEDRLNEMSIEEQITEMREAGIGRAVISGDDLETNWGHKTPNDFIASVVQQYPDVFIGFAGVDPHKGMDAVRELEWAVKELGLKGLNVAPFLYRLRASHKKFYPLYAKCVELGVPVALPTSMHFDPGSVMDFGHPKYLDEVAVDFPELKIVAIHAGWPWIREMIAVAWRHPNVYLEFSGVAPRYLDPELVRYLNTPILADKGLFGTNYPLYPFKRGVEEFKQLPLKEEVLEKVFYKNAARLLQIE